MGLLSGAGGLKGLFARADTGDAFAQAEALLNGDYGTGIDVAARRFQRRRRGSTSEAEKETDTKFDVGADKTVAPATQETGATMDRSSFGRDLGPAMQWGLLGGTELGGGAAMPKIFARWY